MNVGKVVLSMMIPTMIIQEWIIREVAREAQQQLSSLHAKFLHNCLLLFLTPSSFELLSIMAKTSPLNIETVCSKENGPKIDKY